MKNILRYGFLAFASLCLAFGADGVDLSAPKLRDATVSKAQELVKSQKAPAVLGAPLPNPFVRVPLKKSEETPQEAASTPASKAAPALSGVELLTRLAAMIPATGTVNLNGAPILLLSQKRLKVGDTLTISFEDKDYEVSIASISPTAFTIARGSHSYTRPLRLASASNTPSARP